MCSNCSGDDLRPESFATFDVSSPKGLNSFAGTVTAKRKRYGTLRILASLKKTALLQAILHLWGRTAESEIIERIDLGDFVNLNSPAAADQTDGKTRVPPQSRELVQIRVSADAIIEVFATQQAGDGAGDERKLSDARYFSAYEESCAERNKLQRPLSGFRRARLVKYCVAYGTLVTCAAMAIWYAFS